MYCIKHIFPNNTLLVFINLQYENLGFELVKERLIELGYPKEISNIKYKPSFPVSMKVFFMTIMRCINIGSWVVVG